jgi:GNAT superfamily N-acetyltransferase
MLARTHEALLMTYSLPDGISLRELDATAAVDQMSRLVWIWAQANPDVDRTIRKRLIQRHFQCPGFRCLTASRGDIIVGFAYGLHHGQGTGLGDAEGIISIGSHDLLERTIAAGLVQSDWLHAFEIADVQVLSEHRRQGLGESLVRALCDRLASDRIVLTVADKAQDAKRLYQRLGFQEVLRAVPPVSPPVLLTVMGTTLPLPSLDGILQTRTGTNCSEPTLAGTPAMLIMKRMRRHSRLRSG